MDAGFKFGAGSIGLLCSYICGNINYMWIILAILCIFDYISAVAAALKNKEPFDKDKALWGAVQKCFYFAVMIAATLADFFIINQGVPLPGGKALAFVAAMYFVGTEGLSFIKNCGKLGLPLPRQLQHFFESLVDEEDDE